MRFVVIYQNDDNVRRMIEQQIPLLVKEHGVDLLKKEFSTPVFKSHPQWPNSKDMMSLPMSWQCEEFDWEDSKLISVRKLVLDAEIISTDIVKETVK